MSCAFLFLNHCTSPRCSRCRGSVPAPHPNNLEAPVGRWFMYRACSQRVLNWILQFLLHQSSVGVPHAAGKLLACGVNQGNGTVHPTRSSRRNAVDIVVHRLCSFGHSLVVDNLNSQCFSWFLLFLLSRRVGVVCIQETHALEFRDIPKDRPYRHDGLLGQCGREAGFLLHGVVIVSNILGVVDPQHFHWRLVFHTIFVCSFHVPHAGVDESNLLASTAHVVSVPPHSHSEWGRQRVAPSLQFGSRTFWRQCHLSFC